MTHMAPEPSPDHLAEAMHQLAAVQLELDAERSRREELATDFESVLSSMSDALVETDPRGVITRANDAAVALLDPAGTGIVGRPVSTMVDRDIPPSPWRLMEVAPSGYLVRETGLRRTDGERVAVSLSCTCVRDTTGRIDGAMYVARDLTETQRLLAAVEAAEARWRLLVDVSARLGEELEPRDALADVAAHFAAFVGGDVAVILTHDSVVEAVIAPDDTVAAVAELRALPGLRGPNALAGEPVAAGTALARVLGDGKVLHAPSVPPGFPLFSTDATEQPPGSVALVPLTARDRCLGALALFAERPGEVDEVAVDLAEQVADRVAVALTGALLRESVAELESAQRMARFRDDVLAGLSHDMKTPLAVISGSIDTIQEMGDLIPPETTRKLCSGVANHTRRLRRLVMQFLDYTQLESGRSVLVVPSAVEVAAAVDVVVDSYGDRGNFHVDIPADLPLIRADPDRLDQVLSNVIGNALKFSPDDRVVEVTADRTGDEVEIAVVDHGQGISPPDLANIFGKFTRGAATANTEGTGLGLYMSQVLMEAQGARITVASRLGEGSRFGLHFPVAGPGPREAGR